MRFGHGNIKFNTSLVADEPGREYMAEASQVFMTSVEKMCVPQCVPNANDVTVFITTTSPFASLKLSTNESYSLNITTDDCTWIMFNINYNNNTCNIIIMYTQLREHKTVSWLRRWQWHLWGMFDDFCIFIGKIIVDDFLA